MWMNHRFTNTHTHTHTPAQLHLYVQKNVHWMHKQAETTTPDAVFIEVLLHLRSYITTIIIMTNRSVRLFHISPTFCSFVNIAEGAAQCGFEVELWGTFTPGWCRSKELCYSTVWILYEIYLDLVFSICNLIRLSITQTHFNWDTYQPLLEEGSNTTVWSGGLISH